MSESIKKSLNAYFVCNDGFVMSRKTKSLAVYILIFLFFGALGGSFSGFAGLHAQELVIPMVKTPFPVHGATWNKDGTIFAYTEENNIVVRDGNEYSLLQSIQTDKGDLRFMEFTKVTEGNGDQLATLSDQNSLEVRILPNEKPVNAAVVNEEESPTAMAYNWNGNYIATADTGNAIYIYMQNYMTETLIERKSQVLNHIATSLSFSPDNKYLAVGCEDNQIYILDVSSGKVLYSMSYPNEMNITPIFTADSKGIIYPIKKKKIIVTDFYGNVTRTIKAKKQIVSLYLAPDGDTLVLNCEDNVFYFYSIETGKYLGYIPRYSPAKLTCYAFDNNAKKLLQGYADGCIYILDVDETFLYPGETPPKFKLYVADDSTSMKGQQLDPKDLEGGRRRMKGQYKKGHEIVIDTGFSILPSPFIVDVSAGIGYKNYSLIQPFYFGGEIEPFIGFPVSDFPYNYKIKGNDIPSPFLIGAKIYIPVGFAIVPFNNDVEFFGEILGGTSLCALWDRKFGSESITTKIYPSLYVAARVGVGWKFMNVSVRGEYDTILRFSFSTNVGFNIKLPRRKTM